jgi:hypothetical protein
VRKICAVAAAALVFGAISVLGAPSASAAVSCTTASPITNTTINSNVVVPSGEDCVITNSTINGSVTVQPNGSLDIEGSTVNGAVTANQPRFVKIGCVNDGSVCTRKSSVGPVTVTGATQDANYICESTVNGNVNIKDSVGNWSIGSTSGANGTVVCAFGGSNNITGNVSLTGNQDYVALDNNSIGGPVNALNNTGGGEILNNNPVKGSITARNCPQWTVSGNTATGTTTNTSTCI